MYTEQDLKSNKQWRCHDRVERSPLPQDTKLELNRFTNLLTKNKRFDVRRENHNNVIHADHEALMEQAAKIYHAQSQHEITTRV